MVRNIIIGVVALIAAVIGIAFLLPQNVHVERSTVIGAAPDAIYAVVADLTRSKEWGPWYKRDPKMKLTLEGPPAGKGARMRWESATEGSGSQEIVEVEENKRVKTKLDFGEQGIAYATFDLSLADQGGTKVVWSMDTDVGMNPVSRYFGLMFDSWIGKDYEEGLANLKALVEAQARADTNASLSVPGSGAAPPDVPPLPAAADPTKGPEVATIEARPIILTRAKAKASDAAAISAALGAANQKLLNYAMANNLEIGGGAPLAITISHSADEWVFDAAMPLAQAPNPVPPEADGVRVGETYAGRVVKLTHKGPYHTMVPSYERIHAFTKEKSLKEKTTTWEEYVNDPVENPEAELLTNIYVAVE